MPSAKNERFSGEAFKASVPRLAKTQSTCGQAPHPTERNRYGLPCGAAPLWSKDQTLFQNAVIQFLPPPIRRGLHKGNHQWVRLLGLGTQLRLKESGNEEAMRRRLDRAHFALRPARGNRESGFNRTPLVIRIQFEIAEELFLNHVHA